MAKKPGKRRRVLRSIAAIAGATARGIRQAATRGATSKYDVYVSEGDPAAAAKRKAAESGGGGLTRAAKPSRRRGAAAPKKTGAKKSAPKKTGAKKTAAKKAAPKKTAPKKAAAKQPAKKTTAKKTTAPQKQAPVDLTKTRTFDEFKADYREAAKAAKTGDRTAVANAEALRQYGIDNGVLTGKGNPRRSIPGDRVVGADAPQPKKTTAPEAKAPKADAPKAPKAAPAKAKETKATDAPKAPKATKEKAKTTSGPNQAAVDGHAARYADLDAKALDAEQKRIDGTRSRLDRLTPEQREGVAQALDERQAGLDKARAAKGVPSKPVKADTAPSKPQKADNTPSKPQEVKTTRPKPQKADATPTPAADKGDTATTKPEPKPDAEARAAEIEKKRQAIVARREQERRERQAKEKARRDREAKEAAAALAQRNERNKQAATTGDDDPYETRDMTDAELQEAFDDTLGVPDADARKENRAYARELERRGLTNKQDTTPDTGTDTTDAPDAPDADVTTDAPDADTDVDPALTNDDAEYRAAARELHANATTEELEEELQTWADVLSQWGDNPTFEGATDELAHYRAEQNYLTARAALAMRDEDTNPFHADTPDPTTLADLPDTVELPDDVAHVNGLDDGTLHELAGNPDLPGDFRDLVEDELEYRTPWRPDGILEGMLADSPITHIERAQKKYMAEGGLDRQTIETLMTEAGNKRYKNTALMDTLYNGWLDSTIARHRGMEETNTGPVSNKEFARAEGIENYRNDIELQAAPEEIKLVVSELGFIPNKENFMRTLRGEQPKHSDPMVSMKERFGTSKRRTKDERLRDNLKAEGKRVARERKQAGLDTPADAQDTPAAKTRITRAALASEAAPSIADQIRDIASSGGKVAAERRKAARESALGVRHAELVERMKSHPEKDIMPPSSRSLEWHQMNAERAEAELTQVERNLAQYERDIADFKSQGATDKQLAPLNARLKGAQNGIDKARERAKAARKQASAKEAEQALSAATPDAPAPKKRITRAERNQKALDGLTNTNFDVSTSELMEQGGLTRTQALAALKELEDAGLMYRSNEGLGGGGGVERSGGRVKMTDLDWHVPESNLVDFYEARGIDIDETDLYDDDYRNALTREAIGDVFGDVDIDKDGSQVAPPKRANNTPAAPDAPAAAQDTPAAAQATPDTDDDDLAYTPDTELPPVAPEPPKTNPVTGDPLPTYDTPTPQQQKLIDQYKASLSNPTGDDARERVRLRRLLTAEGLDLRTDRDRRFDEAQIAYEPTPAETDPNNPGLYFAPNGAWGAPQTQKVSFGPGESDADLLHVTDDGEVIHITRVNPNKSNARVKLTGTNVHTGQPWSGKTDEYGNLTVRNRFPRHQTPQQHHATIEAREVYGSAYDNNNTDARRIRALVATQMIDRTPDIDGAPIVTDRDVEDAINRAAQKRKDTGLSAKPPRFATHEFAHAKGDPNTIYTRESFRLDGTNDLERAQEAGLYARTPDGTVAPVTDIKRFGYGYRITSTDADGKKHHTKLEMGTHFGMWQNAFTPERYENGQPMTKADYEERQRLLEAASIARARYTDNPLEKMAGDRAASDIGAMAEAIRTKNPEPPTPAQKVRQAAEKAANRPAKSAYMARKPADRDAAVYEDALQGEASTTAQIAEATGMTRAQTLKTLNRLEQRGLIARQEQDDAAMGAQNRVSGGRNTNDDLVWVDNFRDGDAANERAALLDAHRNGTTTNTTTGTTGGSDAEAWANNIADDDVEEQWNILESRRRSDNNARAGVPGRELTTAERDELEARRKALRPRLEANKEATNARYDAAYNKASSLNRIRELTNTELFEAREGASREKRRVGRGGGLAYEEATRRGRQLKAEQDRRRREGIVINEGDGPAPAPRSLKPHRTGTAFTADHLDDGERLLINGNIERNGVEMTPDHRIIDKDGQPREQYRNMKALRKEADYQARRRQAPEGTTPAPSASASADDNLVDYSAIGGFNLTTLGTADLQRIIDEGGPQAADARRILADRARG